MVFTDYNTSSRLYFGHVSPFQKFFSKDRSLPKTGVLNISQLDLYTIILYLYRFVYNLRI